jgi:hypothetical protein
MYSDTRYKLLIAQAALDRVHGSVRILTSTMQVQRFEVAVSSFNNCQAHLNAALSLFSQILDSPSTVEPVEPSTRFNAVISLLGSSSLILPAQWVQIPSAEQATFRFTFTLLILDDIIASTVLQEQPRLYEYHHSLLIGSHSTECPINFEATVGCQN